MSWIHDTVRLSNNADPFFVNTHIMLKEVCLFDHIPLFSLSKKNAVLDKKSLSLRRLSLESEMSDELFKTEWLFIRQS